MRTAIFLTILALTSLAVAQQQKAQQPPVKVNVLNVCAPSADDRSEIAAALARIPRQPKFGADFEVARGHTTVENKASDWVRVHRDFSSGPFSAAQYLYSREGSKSREAVVLFARDPKDVSQIAVEDSVTSPVQPAELLKTNTPASHISIERMSKPHVVLARCPDVDQSALEPLFAQASEVMAAYRSATGAREIVPAEIDRLSLGVGPGYRAPKVKPMGKRK